MIATWVPDRLTPMTFEQAAEAMRAALRDKLSDDPPREVLALALAKSALETGRWRAIHCWNWGNQKAGEKYVGNYCCFELNEVLNGKVVWFGPRGRLDRKGGSVVAEPFDDPPGHPQTRMRAYANRFDGAFSYVDFVAGGRYAAAWQRLLAGDAVGFVAALKKAGYMTADEAPYRNAVVSLQKEFLGKLAGQSPDEFDQPDHEWEALRAQIVGRSWERVQDAVDQADDTERAKTDPAPPPSERP